MKIKRIQLWMIGSILFLASCGGNEKVESEENDKDKDVSEELVSGESEELFLDADCDVLTNVQTSFEYDEINSSSNNFDTINSAIFNRDVAKSYALIQPDDNNGVIYFVVQVPAQKEMDNLEITLGSNCENDYTGFNFITKNSTRSTAITYVFDLSLSGSLYWRDSKRLIVMVDGDKKKVAISKTSLEPSKID